MCVWGGDWLFGLVVWGLWHINHYGLFNAKSSLNIYNIYDLSSYLVDNIFESHVCVCLNKYKDVNGSKTE